MKTKVYQLSKLIHLGGVLRKVRNSEGISNLMSGVLNDTVVLDSEVRSSSYDGSPENSSSV